MNISLRINKQFPNNDGEVPLYFRLRFTESNGKQTESNISTGLHIRPTHLKNGVLSPRIPKYNQKTEYLSTIRTDLDYVITEVKMEGFIPTPKLIKKRYQEKQTSKELYTPTVRTFWGSYDEYIDTKKHKTKGYVKTIITLKNRLKDFEEWKGIRLNFEYIVDKHKSFQFEFQDYLWTERNLSNNYVNKLFINLSQYLHYCKTNDYIKKKPKFSKNDTVDRDEKIYLYKKEVHKLFKSSKWDYVDEKDFSKNPHIYIIEDVLEGTRKEKYGEIRKLTNWEMVKDIFLFQCSIGCRYSDIPHFKVNHFDFNRKTGMFSWIQQKTNKRVNVPVNEVSGGIFRKYSRGKSLSQPLFPTLSIQKFNKSLKFLLKDLNFNRLVSYPKKISSHLINTEDKFLWELISSHSGRRTFIKNMIDVGTMDYKTIMTMSGHKTFKEFEKYISVSPNDLKKGMKLYQLDNPKTDDEVKELVKKYVELDEENKMLILKMVRNLS